MIFSLPFYLISYLLINVMLSFWEFNDTDTVLAGHLHYSVLVSVYLYAG